MALVAGTRLGPYEIQSLIGVGGMGEVYRAKDTRLDRTVAIKVLPESLAADPDRRARFEREAHAIAALSNPHICTLHDIGTENGTTYLVMEHLAGESLADRLSRGPLPLGQVLALGAQIADGLAAAHKAGIVHRDLKPANVMLVRGATASGPSVVKLLDFGLAKLTARQAVGQTRSWLVTTREGPATAQGTILGTLPYMAPEQLEGREADSRTDVWALGCVLYEMATGQRAFAGATDASLIAAIMSAEPPSVGTLQPLTPAAFEHVIGQCLAKDPDERWQSAHDLRYELRWIAGAAAEPTAAAVRLPSWRRAALFVFLPSVMLAAVLGAMAVWTVRPSPPHSIVWAQLGVRPAADVFNGPMTAVHTRGGSRTPFDWTPNGRAIIFVGRANGVQHLYVRDLDREDARLLPHTEDGQVPAVSPDGRWVVFWATGAIKRVPFDGGPADTVVPNITRPPSGIAVGTAGRTVFSTEGVIWQVSSGSEARRITTPEKDEYSHVLPQLIRDDDVLLFTARTSAWTWGNERVVAQVLATGERRVLVREGADARYVSTGHLLFVRRGLLMAVPFDLARLQVTGEPVALLDGVAQALTSTNGFDITGAGHFRISSTGSLAYISSPVIPFPEAALVTVDRQGRENRLPVETRSYGPPVRVSPDRHRLAVTVRTVRAQALWIVDVARGSGAQVTAGEEIYGPRWTPDGQRIAFRWVAKGVSSLAWQRADGSAPPDVWVPGTKAYPSSWTPDGQHLVTSDEGDLWVASVGERHATLERITATSETEWHPELSPDGRWLAYASDKTGRFEVYIRPYPDPGPAIPVSVDGGQSPAWNSRGGELFFHSVRDPAGRYRLMAVNIQGSRVGTPRALFDIPNDLVFSCFIVRCYDVSADGQRFFVTKRLPTLPPPPVTEINLVLNWVEELKAKVPVK